MSVDLAYFMLATMLTLWAARRAPGPCSFVLCGSMAASWAVLIAEPWSAIPFISAIDAMVCLAMMAIWPNSQMVKAKVICGIGIAKTFVSLFQYTENAYAVSWAYAIFINLAYILQVLIAGGFLDAVGHRLDSLLRSDLPVLHSLLHDGKREDSPERLNHE